MKKNILILAPHPDDEVLGCGGVIRKFSEMGHQVYVLIATRGSEKRYSQEKVMNVRKEATDAHAVLGVTETLFLDFPAPELDLVSKADLSSQIFNILNKLEIDDLFLPHRGDIHHDHQAIYMAGLVAARPTNQNSVKRIYAYETLSETEWAAPFPSDAFIPTYFVDVAKHIEYKLKAMEKFKSQLRPFPSSRSLEAIKSLAKFRGATVGFNFAEAFMVVRVIED